MTLVSQIITDAFRQSNLLAINVAPTALQQAEALRYLNRILKSVLGYEAGEQLNSFPVGRNNIQNPPGYPWWNTVPSNVWYVPKNTRIMLNLDQSVNLYLHPAPDDGTRFGAVDVSKNTSTYPVTVIGNGNNIEDATSITLNVDGASGEWFYREDLANWLKYAPLVEVDTFPFPEEFDDFFITMLAMRINPSYGTQLDQQSERVLARSRNQLRARYSQKIPVRSELGLIRMPITAADRDYYWDYWGEGYGNPNALFDKGYPW